MITLSMAAILLSLDIVGQAPAKAPNGSGEWFVIESKEGMFSFAMPVRPRELTSDQQTPAGKIKTTVYICQNADTALAVRHEIVPRAPSLDQLADTFATRLVQVPVGSMQIVSRKSITIQGVPGREFVLTWEDLQGHGKGTARVCVLTRGTNVYVLSASSSNGKPLPPESTTFLDSARFDGKPAVRPAMALATAPPPVASPTKPAAAAKAAMPPKRNLIGRIDRVDTTSEAAFRTFLMAIEAGDEETLRAVTLPHPDFDWLLRGEPARRQGIVELKQQMIKARVQRLKAGDKVKLAGNEVHTIRAAEVGPDHAALRMDGTPAYAPLERVKGHWKVDPAPFIAVRKAAWAAKDAPKK
jgi:hypothetical protein